MRCILTDSRLPWLQTGAVAAAVGIALAGAPAAAADDATTAGASTESAASDASPRAAAGPTARHATRATSNRRTAETGSSQSGTPRAAAAGPRRGATLPAPAAAERTPAITLPDATRPAGSSAGTAAWVPDPAPQALAVQAVGAAPVMTALTRTVDGILDTVANLLSSVGANPINDLISGALLLTRRTLSLLVSDPVATPTATSIWLPNAGTYGTGTTMNFVVNFDQPVVVNNTDSLKVALPIEMDYHLYGAQYVSGSGTGSLVFSLSVPRYLVGFNGVSIGVVSGQTGIRVLGFDGLVTSKSNPAITVSDAIPLVDTHRIAANSVGPQITGRSDLQVDGSAVTLSVSFDGPVVVSGAPTVPVSVNGVNRLLTYNFGSGSNTLTFRYADPAGAAVTSAAFRTETGDVIYLPVGTATIRDQLGNPIYTLEGNLDTPLYETENGIRNQMVVIGQHFEKLATYSTDVLDGILNRDQALEFYTLSSKYPPQYNAQFDTWPFWVPFTDPVTGELPAYDPAENGVDVYRVSFRSWVPEQQRYTTDYGLLSIPTGTQGEIPVVMWQQPTVFDPVNSAPSLAFSCGPNPGADCRQQDENQTVRFQVAQFGGKGYAVFMPDVFGLGNSNKYNDYAYLVKGSAAQWSTDFYNAATSLLAARNLQESHLFLAGWSAGGLESADWLDSLESQGRTVSGMAVASSPLSVGPAERNAIFNPRPWTTTNTGDAVWLGVGVGLNSFALGGYQGMPGTALDVVGQYYEILRRLYTRDYPQAPLNPLFGPEWPYPDSTKPENGISLTYKDVNGKEQTAFMPYQLTDLIVPKYSSNEVAYDNSDYAKMMDAAGSGRAPWSSPVYMLYSQQDEVLTPTMGKTVYSWQQQAYGKQNISFVETMSANHRGNFLVALQNYLEWFDGIIAAG